LASIDDFAAAKLSEPAERGASLAERGFRVAIR